MAGSQVAGWIVDCGLWIVDCRVFRFIEARGGYLTRGGSGSSWWLIRLVVARGG